MVAQSEFESESQRPERHRIDQATLLGHLKVKRKLYNKTIVQEELRMVNNFPFSFIYNK